MSDNSQGKEYMVHKIKQWLAVENKLDEYLKQVKELKKMRKELNVDLLEIMKNNDIDCFDCTSGKIMYTKNNVKKGINRKYLHTILNKYYGQDDSIEAQKLCEFIMENRQVDVKENIKLKKNK